MTVPTPKITARHIRVVFCAFSVVVNESPRPCCSSAFCSSRAALYLYPKNTVMATRRQNSRMIAVHTKKPAKQVRRRSQTKPSTRATPAQSRIQYLVWLMSAMALDDVSRMLSIDLAEVSEVCGLVALADGSTKNRVPVGRQRLSTLRVSNHQ
eukprot:Amastigsp_a676325_859.p4 type:complete len:153 gc:universal Amastigsp_a676325_859:1052-594(-)